MAWQAKMTELERPANTGVARGDTGAMPPQNF